MSWTTASTNLADYTPFSISAPLDPRLPGRRRLYDRRPVQPRADQGRAGGRARAVFEQFRGADRELAGRGCLRRTRGCGMGSRCRAGTSTGRRVADGCAVRAVCRNSVPARLGLTNSSVTANVNALGGGPFALGVNNPYCRIAEPYRTDFRGLRVIRDPESGCSGSRNVGEHPGGLPARGLHCDQCVDRRPDRSRSAELCRALAPFR